MKRLIMLVTVAGLVTLGACNKKSEAPPPGPASGAVAPPPPPPITAPPSGAAPGSAGSAAPAAGSGSAAVVDVPAEMDFEAEAAKKITDKNVEAQVKAIEAELQQK
jgi:hypothetical protein